MKEKFQQQKTNRLETNPSLIGAAEKPVNFAYGSPEEPGGHNKELFPMVRKQEILDRINDLVKYTPIVKKGLDSDFPLMKDGTVGVTGDVFNPTMNMGNRKPIKFFSKQEKIYLSPSEQVPEGVQVITGPEGGRYYYAKPKPPKGYEPVKEEFTLKLKETRESLDFITTNSHRFREFSPTQQTNFAEKLFEAWKIIGSLGRQMEEEVKQAKQSRGEIFYTADNPANPISRARSHLKSALQAIKDNKPSWVEHELLTFSSDYHEALRKYEDGARKIVQKSVDKISDEAEPHKIKTKLQDKVLGDIKYFERKGLEAKVKSIVKDIEDKLDKEVVIQSFLKGYQKLALLSKQMNDEEVTKLFDLAKEVNIIKGFNLRQSSEIDRLEQVIFSDSVAHSLHSNKDTEGKSRYFILDELADISKSMGEKNRNNRLLILDSPAENIKKLEDLAKIEILHKGKLLEKSLSLWKIFESAIRDGIEKLSDDQLVALREFLYARI